MKRLSNILIILIFYLFFFLLIGCPSSNTPDSHSDKPIAISDDAQNGAETSSIGDSTNLNTDNNTPGVIDSSACGNVEVHTSLPVSAFPTTFLPEPTPYPTTDSGSSALFDSPYPNDIVVRNDLHMAKVDDIINRSDAVNLAGLVNLPTFKALKDFKYQEDSGTYLATILGERIFSKDGIDYVLMQINDDAFSDETQIPSTPIMDIQLTALRVDSESETEIYSTSGTFTENGLDFNMNLPKGVYQLTIAGKLMSQYVKTSSPADVFKTQSICAYKQNGNFSISANLQEPNKLSVLEESIDLGGIKNIPVNRIEDDSAGNVPKSGSGDGVVSAELDNPTILNTIQVDSTLYCADADNNKICDTFSTRAVPFFSESRNIVPFSTGDSLGYVWMFGTLLPSPTPTCYYKYKNPNDSGEDIEIEVPAQCVLDDGVISYSLRCTNSDIPTCESGDLPTCPPLDDITSASTSDIVEHELYCTSPALPSQLSLRMDDGTHVLLNENLTWNYEGDDSGQSINFPPYNNLPMISNYMSITSNLHWIDILWNVSIEGIGKDNIGSSIYHAFAHKEDATWIWKIPTGFNDRLNFTVAHNVLSYTHSNGAAALMWIENENNSGQFVDSIYLKGSSKVYAAIRDSDNSILNKPLSADDFIIEGDLIVPIGIVINKTNDVYVIVNQDQWEEVGERSTHLIQRINGDWSTHDIKDVLSLDIEIFLNDYLPNETREYYDNGVYTIPKSIKPKSIKMDPSNDDIILTSEYFLTACCSSLFMTKKSNSGWDSGVTLDDFGLNYDPTTYEFIFSPGSEIHSSETQIDLSGNILVTWAYGGDSQTEENATGYIYFAEYSSKNGWKKPKLTDYITNKFAGVNKVVSAINGTHALIVWTEKSNGTYTIYQKERIKGTWLDNKKVYTYLAGIAGDSERSPKVAIANSGKAIITFGDTETSENDSNKISLANQYSLIYEKFQSPEGVWEWPDAPRKVYTK